MPGSPRGAAAGGPPPSSTTAGGRSKSVPLTSPFDAAAAAAAAAPPSATAATTTWAATSAATTVASRSVGGSTAGGGGAAGAPCDVGDLARLSRMHSFATLHSYTRRPPPAPPKLPPPPLLLAALRWWAAWAIPGLGMFSEAYIIFSIGLIAPLQAAAYPECFRDHIVCTREETHAAAYAPVAAIIGGMLVFGFAGDALGRRCGSRAVAGVMLLGSFLLTASPAISDPRAYLQFSVFAQTLYGFGVGGEYPMASASAAERAQSDPRLRVHRGRQVVLTFSQQGAGNLANACAILALMAAHGQFYANVDARAARAIIAIQFALAAAVSVFMFAWRAFKLQESEVWRAERADAVDIAASLERRKPHYLYRTVLRNFGPRLAATGLAWVANDFAFYGNKLFLSAFLKALYPKATPIERLQWSAVNAAVALAGYYGAAALVDTRWFGRRTMQTSGFLAMAVLFSVCAGAYTKLTASPEGYRALQALYFLSSFFNQLGPNCTTWLVAAEVFPTDVRAALQGVSAAAGKLGAVAADVAFGYVGVREAFYLSAASGVAGALVTLALLPDTTGLSLDELDRLHKYMLTGHFSYYHGPAVAERHLSLFERYVLRWHGRHDPDLDAAHREFQYAAAGLPPGGGPLLAAPPPPPSLSLSHAGSRAGGGGSGGLGALLARRPSSSAAAGGLPRAWADAWSLAGLSSAAAAAARAAGAAAPGGGAPTTTLGGSSLELQRRGGAGVPQPAAPPSTGGGRSLVGAPIVRLPSTGEEALMAVEGAGSDLEGWERQGNAAGGPEDEEAALAPAAQARQQRRPRQQQASHTGSLEDVD